MLNLMNAKNVICNNATLEIMTRNSNYVSTIAYNIENISCFIILMLNYPINKLEFLFS